MQSVTRLWPLRLMGRGAKSATSAQSSGAALEKLRKRAGVTLAELAAACGLAGPSGFQKYTNPNREIPVPVHIVRSIESLLIDRGSPPITRRELWEQVANAPEMAEEGEPSNPRITTAALQLAEAMGFKMRDHETGIILENLRILQRLGRNDFSIDDAAQALRQISSVIGQRQSS